VPRSWVSAPNGSSVAAHQSKRILIDKHLHPPVTQADGKKFRKMICKGSELMGGPSIMITLIFLEFPNKGGFPLVPPVLEYLAALTHGHRPEIEITLIDANRSPTTIVDIIADLALSIGQLRAHQGANVRFRGACGHGDHRHCA